MANDGNHGPFSNVSPRQNINRKNLKLYKNNVKLPEI